ncbi:ABC transporter permease [Teredinibacter purpureus]|uniref:ABC transporter permease n=1 Tax=Teredinibacter purpureus TaxID=2731756 RepID=UPI0005F820DD|nr:FtsX-like permease family protein [Teredinibacter purpureus]
MATNISLRLAWRNLWRHRRRTWLTLGAMVFSNVLLIFMIALQQGSYSMMIDNSLRALSGHIQVQANGYQEEQKMRMVVPDIENFAVTVREQLSTDTVAARAIGFAMASSEERSFGIQVTGVQPMFEPLVSSIPGLVKEGDYFTGVNTHEIVIGTVLARNLNVTVGDEITLLGGGYDGSIAADIVTVVGVFDSGIKDLDRSLAQLPLNTFQTVFSMGSAGHSLVIAAPNLPIVPLWQREVQSLLAADMPLAVLDWDKLQPGLKQAIKADMSSAAFMYFVLVILVAFSVLNTQLMSVLERTREFGIMLALGLRSSRISLLVVSETLLLSLMGLVIGVLIGFCLILFLSYSGFTYPGMEEMSSKFNMPSEIFPTVSALSLLLGPSFVFVGSLLASIYPAGRIHTLQPVMAMRAV